MRFSWARRRPAVFMRIPGINLNGVMSANEFLTRVNLMKGYKFPDYDTPVKTGHYVAVVGAGNVAMDSRAARSACRCSMLPVLGMGPAVGRCTSFTAARVPRCPREEEFHHAGEEGVLFDFLTNPVEILGDDKGNVRGMRCIRMALGDPTRPAGAHRSRSMARIRDAGGHRYLRPGHQPEPDRLQFGAGPERSKHGTVIANPETGRTKLPGVWAGGDVVTGAATVISAMGAGKRAAADMHTFLSDPSMWELD